MMNERIKELAKEAAVVYQKTLPPATHTTPLYLMDKLGKDAKAAGIEIISDGFCEKFAELIIRECVELSVNSQYTNTKSEYYEGFNEGLIYFGNKIKKHFGVEE